MGMGLSKDCFDTHLFAVIELAEMQSLSNGGVSKDTPL